MALKRVPKNRRSLSAYTSIKIGGIADDFYTVFNIDELCEVFKQYGKDIYLLGAGSNILVTDDRLSLPVIRLKGDFDYVKFDGPLVQAGGGTLFSGFLQQCIKNGLGGVENLVGIPGTIGGMLAMNASAYKRAISDHLEAVEIFDEKKKVKRLLKGKVIFDYRHSSLMGHIILHAWFRFHEDRFVKEKARDILKDRVAKQDYEHPSFGSVFKNPAGFSAGQLIDSCGLKGLRENGAQISPKHANFIINLGNAACKDVEYLIDKAKAAVLKKHNIILEEEVARWI